MLSAMNLAHEHMSRLGQEQLGAIPPPNKVKQEQIREIVYRYGYVADTLECLPSLPGWQLLRSSSKAFDDY